MCTIPKESLKNGVYTASAGNFAQVPFLESTLLSRILKINDDDMLVHECIRDKTMTVTKKNLNYFAFVNMSQI